jgi:hypothetical protein
MDFTRATCVQLTERGLKNYWLSEAVTDQWRARMLCRECPVQTECAIYAIQAQPTFGVWAGGFFGPAEREEAARKRKNAARNRKRNAITT